MNEGISDALPSTSEISEALHATAVEYGGLGWAVDEQVAVARRLRAVTVESQRNKAKMTTAKEIREAFAAFALKPPPRGYASRVVARLHRLYDRLAAR
jgi:hypothetical protein